MQTHVVFDVEIILKNGAYLKISLRGTYQQQYYVDALEWLMGTTYIGTAIA